MEFRRRITLRLQFGYGSPNVHLGRSMISPHRELQLVLLWGILSGLFRRICRLTPTPTRPVSRPETQLLTKEFDN